MSIDNNLNNYRQAKNLLQGIIDGGVKTKKELIELLKEELTQHLRYVKKNDN